MLPCCVSWLARAFYAEKQLDEVIAGLGIETALRDDPMQRGPAEGVGLRQPLPLPQLRHCVAAPLRRLRRCPLGRRVELAVLLHLLHHAKLAPLHHADQRRPKLVVLRQDRQLLPGARLVRVHLARKVELDGDHGDIILNSLRVDDRARAASCVVDARANAQVLRQLCLVGDELLGSPILLVHLQLQVLPAPHRPTVVIHKRLLFAQQHIPGLSMSMAMGTALTW